MARRTLHRLSARQAATILRPGRHADGGGLYLVVSPSGARRWVFLYRWKEPGVPGPGKLREMGLGSFTSVTLAMARDRAAAARLELANRTSPLAAKRTTRAVPTFGEMADEFITTRSATVRSDKSIARWKRALETYAAALRPLPVDVVQTEAVLACVKPIWLSKPETAKNVRAYVEAVLDAAAAKGFRSGANPARLKGHLDHLLAPRPRLSRGHHAALPFEDVPAFVAELRLRQGMSALALEFLILTAARSGEVIEADWSEIDLAGRRWIIPPQRMKAGREHRVPLSSRAVKILQFVAKASPADPPQGWVFPGPKAAKPMSNMAFAMLLRRMGRMDITTHGFRSAFRDWAGETTDIPREIAEAALAHTVGNETERAYRRGDAFEKRRLLMDRWAEFVEADQGAVSDTPSV